MDERCAAIPSPRMTIRRQPADFVVTERPSAAFLGALVPARSGATTHAVYELCKQSLGTPEAVAALARAVGVRAGQVDYAGLKDKHALTTQLVSIPVPGAKPPPAEVASPGITARRLGWCATPVTADCIEGNGFEIVVRDLSVQASAEMERRARLLTSGDGLVVINYFGAQRFGSARHGQGFAARHLIRGEFEQAVRLLIGTPARKDSGKTRQFTRLCATKWGAWKELAEELPRCPERRAIEALAAGGDFKAAFEALPPFTQQMCVEAFQSHLWNAAARGLVEKLLAGAMVEVGSGKSEVGSTGGGAQRWRPVEPLRADDDFGVMFFPPATHVDGTWREVVMPVLGPKTLLKEPWGHTAAAVLTEEEIKQEELRIPGVRRPYFGEADRPFFAAAKGFAMSPAEGDEFSSGKRGKRTVRFDLGRGSYATVVLRALGQ